MTTFREEILARDGYRCVQCGSEKSLQVDHIVARINGGGDDPSNLQTLCAHPCHSAKTVRDKREADERRDAERLQRPGYTGAPRPETIHAGLDALVEGLRRKYPGALITVQDEASPERETPGLQKGDVTTHDDFT